MRIRRRPQPQIPISDPDPASVHAGAASSAGGGAGAAAADVVAPLLLHRVGDPPTSPGGCNVHGPPASRGDAEVGDLLRRSNLLRLGQKIDCADDGGRTAAQTLLLLQGEEQYQEAVVDAHRRAWSSGGLHSTDRSGAEASRSIRVQQRRGAGGSRLAGVQESMNCEPMRTSAHVFTTATAALASVDTINGAANNDDDGEQTVEANGRIAKRKSPAALMEGSRCSRVNGRGWRCFRQTLVGYSLCEHHLGKGRLRSLTSTSSNTRRRKPQPPPPSEDEDEEDLKVAYSNSRRKSGTVKARSISSLLVDQTSRAAAAAASMAMPIPLPATLQDESPPATLHVPPLDQSMS